MKHLFRAFALLSMFSVMVLFVGCYPNDDATIDEYDIAVTLYDKSYDFSPITTYMLVDTVGHGDISNPSKIYDATILDAVEKGLNALGWTASTSDDPKDADVLVFCSAINTDIYSYWADYWYPYWYDYWWDYYYYYPIPYYPWSYGGLVYNYSEGTVVIQMMDSKATADKKIAARWAGVIDGITNDTQIDIENRIQVGVAQCFEQSPYLKK